MNLFYAMGGGLGHVTRSLSVAHTLGLGDIAVMTASTAALDERVLRGARPVAVPPGLDGDRDGFGRWLAATLKALAPSAIYIDTFSAGILGELAHISLPATTPLFHVARRLRWEAYADLAAASPHRFAATYAVERLHPEQLQFLGVHSDRFINLPLHDPPQLLPPEIATRIDAWRAERPLWLVVHSGPAAETQQLVEYAREMIVAEALAAPLPRIVVVAPHALADEKLDDNVPAIEHLDCNPAAALFPAADRIITACGFNIMRQTAPYRTRHRFLPFPRRYDDQYFRAEQARGRS